MDSFALKYLLLIIGGCLGVYQIAAALGGFKGLRLCRSGRRTFFVGLLFFAATFGWFFTTTDLKRPHIEIEGSQQLWSFLIGSFVALLATVSISSFINRNGMKPNEDVVIDKGLEDIKDKTVLQAFAHRLRHRNEGTE